MSSFRGCWCPGIEREGGVSQGKHVLCDVTGIDQHVTSVLCLEDCGCCMNGEVRGHEGSYARADRGMACSIWLTALRFVLCLLASAAPRADLPRQWKFLSPVTPRSDATWEEAGTAQPRGMFPATAGPGGG